MTDDDVADVAELESRCFPGPFSAATLLGYVRNPVNVWKVVRTVTENASTSSPVLGYVGNVTSSSRWHMLKIGVLPDWRRRGLGEWLVLDSLMAAGRTGAKSLTLEVRASNTAALHMYAKLGFGMVSRVAGYYQDTGEEGVLLEFSRLDDPKVIASLSEKLTQERTGG